MKKSKKVSQNDHFICRLQAAQWLFDPIGNRRTGRSYLLSLAYINLSLKYPGVWIRFRDHHFSHISDQIVGGYIHAHAKKLKKMKFEFKIDQFRLVEEYP